MSCVTWEMFHYTWRILYVRFCGISFSRVELAPRFYGTFCAKNQFLTPIGLHIAQHGHTIHEFTTSRNDFEELVKCSETPTRSSAAESLTSHYKRTPVFPRGNISANCINPESRNGRNIEIHMCIILNSPDAVKPVPRYWLRGGEYDIKLTPAYLSL